MDDAHPPTSWGTTRRTVLTGGAAGVAAIGLSALGAGPADAATRWYGRPAWQTAEWNKTAGAYNARPDVLVVGGGLSGCAAAISAAREGMQVLLVEPTHMLGGQMSAAGVGTADFPPVWQRIVETGLWGEFVRRCRSIYNQRFNGKPTNVARYRLPSFAANPVIVDEVLTRMLMEHGVEVVRHHPPISAYITDAVAAVRFEFGKIEAKVAVDATEDGALLELGRFTYRLGNAVVWGGQRPNKDLKDLDIQSVTLSAVVKRYDSGIPSALKVTEKPDGYDRNRWWIAIAYPTRPDKTYGSFAGYRALPDLTGAHYVGTEEHKVTRTCLNFRNDALVHGAYIVDPVVRHAGNKVAMDRTLSVLYYLQNELGLKWALAGDEGFNAGQRPHAFSGNDSYPEMVKHTPLYPYIREARRLVGKTTMTYKHVRRVSQNDIAPWHPDCVAVGYYPSDLHDGKAPTSFESIFGESSSTITGFQMGAHPVLKGSFVPADNRCLVVAEKNLSMSRIAAGAIRVHPTMMAVGQAAGIIAAGSVTLKVSPRDVPTPAVQVAMVQQRAMIAPLNVSGIHTGHPDWQAISMAIARKKATYTEDIPRQVLRMATAQKSAAVRYGRSALKAYNGRI